MVAECLTDAIIGGITDDNVSWTIRWARYTDINIVYGYLNRIGDIPNLVVTPKLQRFQASSNPQKDKNISTPLIIKQQ